MKNDKRIGIIRLDRILQTSKRAQAEARELDRLARQHDEAIAGLRRRLEQAAETLRKLAPEAAPEERYAAELALDRTGRDLRNAEEDRRIEVEARRRFALERLSGAVDPVLRRLAEERGLEVVLTLPSPLVAYVRAGADLTDDLVTRFDAESTR